MPCGPELGAPRFGGTNHRDTDFHPNPWRMGDESPGWCKMPKQPNTYVVL